MVDTTTPLFRDTNMPPSQSAAAADYAVLLSGDRLLAVVELLMRSPEALSARAIADATGIHRSTTHRALNTLIHRGWVERQPESADYRLSVKFLALAHVATQERSFLREVRPALERLSALSRETVHVGVLDGLDVLHLDKIDSLERVGVASKIGSRGPAHSASLGRALLAASSDRMVEEFLIESDLSRGAHRIPDLTRFREEIARTRQRGYSLDDEEDSIGVRCLGVAVRGAGGAPLFAISMTGPSARFTLERALSFAPAAVEIARDLSVRLGWQGKESEVGGRRSEERRLDGQTVRRPDGQTASRESPAASS
jgi:IclR family transcriptional regulator, KDG regulon repressor